MSAPWRLAIDFGTSFTTVAMRVEERVEVLEVDSSRYVPSTVCLDPDGGLLVGRDAVSEAALRPANAERLPKRAMTVTDRVRLGDRTVETVDLVAAVLRRVAREAYRRRGHEPPTHVVLTHPARWQPGGTELTRLAEAARRAGLPEPDLVAEPVAAAHHYIHSTGRDVEQGAAVAVYDLGGGTFDTAVLRRCEGGFELAGPPGGDLHLGGEDLDDALMELVGAHATTLDADAWSTLWDGTGVPAERARAQLRRDVTAAKESLSLRIAVNLHVPGYDDELRVTRAEYERAVETMLQRSVTELVDTITRAGTTPHALTCVYLTGGSSRTPLVSGLLASLLHRLPVVQDDPKAVVVQGALEIDPGSVSLAAPVRALGATGVFADVARELTTIAAAAGVGDLVGVVSLDRSSATPKADLRAALAEVEVAVARRFGPFPGLPPRVSLQLLREGRSELGELGRALTRLDRLATRLDALPAPAAAPAR